MAKKKNQKRKQTLTLKGAVESLRFQTQFGLKQMGVQEDDFLQKLAQVEIDLISDYGLTQDILGIKKLIDGAKSMFQVEPTSEMGDFCASITAIALHIARIPNLADLQMPVSWEEQINKKLLTIYFPEDKRNAVVDWAKANGFNTSTYLGLPMVKFDKLYVIIERSRI